MEIDGKNYTLDQLREKMPKYKVFFYEKVHSDSLEETLDKDPTSTTNPNLHMRYDTSSIVKRGRNEVFDRIYTFLGRVGVNIYSSRKKFFHDEEDTELSEQP